ncbi:hypothetical protein [Pseudomonas costantinii]|uniref:Uncharacterized protein n=1 Tax=Pseudomonas costantinii TaxID=168469 RepID=A0A1S2UE50_9PSED|nr:hypothetical protein [Pseudomonas costantinii]OIN44509.1 hypothetical protein BFL40_29930 [Pseudomonas costantinii]
MNKWILLFGMCLAPLASASATEKSCSVVSCNAGDKATTHIEDVGSHYFACPTKEISEYVNFVWALVYTSYQMTGSLPNISPKTGEPEYEGQSKSMIDSLRSQAGVSTYDQAQGQCAKGRNKIQVMVMNNPKDSLSIWVADKNNKAFWMPKAFLNKR